eukprot:TRINITY_DN65281_c0_g1_i1.p1 TRINITY_DN65281_c0_g1~~TRINITY_DN65281_c0_g1_i1.p1  ORF type:complete len:619 (+),score=253.92 TRINITY_DN65281_c0_g1_i1:82-1938(+)
MAGGEFIVLVACDINGKCNFELGFPARPTIPELRDRLEEDIAQECQFRRGQAAPFLISRAQIFDERLEMWVDLTSQDQLENFCQVYVFQRDHRDTPGRIPPPVKPMPGRHGPRQYQYGAPMRQAGGTPGGAECGPAPSAGPYDAPTHYPVESPYYASPQGGGSTPPGPYGGAHSGSDSPPYAGSGAEPQHAACGKGRHLPECPGHADKVRLVFGELDLRKTHTVTQDDWRQIFERVRLTGSDDGRSPFSEQTADDLFTRAAGGTGEVTLNTFQPFAEFYPKLLDAIYFRSRDWYEDEARRERLQQEREKGERLERRLDEARDGAAGAAADSGQAQQRAEDAAQDLESAKEREQQAQLEKQDAAAEVDAARGEVAAAKKGQQGVKDQLKKRDADKRFAERGVGAAEKQVKQKRDELDKAEKERERLVRALANQEKEIERKRQELERAEQEVGAARERVDRQQDPALDEEAQRALDAVAQAESKLKQAQDEDGQRARALKEAQRAVHQQQQQKQAAEKEVQAAKGKGQQRQQQEERAQRELEQQTSQIEKLEQQQQEYEDRRRDQESTEAELLQMEARLREQRESVEKKEQQLRHAHRDFSQGYGRASPPRGRNPEAYRA